MDDHNMLIYCRDQQPILLVDEEYSYWFFDKFKIIYEEGGRDIEIFNDIASEAMVTLQYSLEYAPELPGDIKLGAFGKDFNKAIFNGKDATAFSCFWLWSTVHGPETLMYRRNGILYMEIVPMYPGLLSEGHGKNFDDFIQGYQPIAFFAIDSQTIQKWLGICETVSDQMYLDDGGSEPCC